jgi:Rrf2 family protein
MKKSTKLSDMLHLLLHMAESKVPLTSETLAKAMQTNAVVVRRIMAGLREQGLVTSEKGHGGGWRLSCDLKVVTLHDIYRAIGSPTLLAIGNRAEASDCLIESAVAIAAQEAFVEAENAVIEKFRNTTLAELQGMVKKLSHTRRQVQEK